MSINRAEMVNIIRLLVLLLLITSCSSTDRRSDAKYSEDEINLFVYLIQNSSHQDKIIKWDKREIRITTHGAPSNQDALNINQLISDLGEIIPQVHFLIVTEDPDIEIFFASVNFFDDIFMRYDVEDETNRSWGAGANSVEKCKITKTILAVPDELTPAKYRRIVLRSLFVRELGFNTGNFYKSNLMKSIFSGYFEFQQTEMVNYEKQMIRMMFEPELKPGMTMDEARVILQRL